jgi:hypothetical protein
MPQSSLGDSMPLRRIIEHFREQNWIAVWLDVIIVFLGVFIGLQADNWNDTRVARSQARTYYARLIEDLRAEESTRIAMIAYYQRTKEHGEFALRALQKSDGSMGEKFLIDIYQSTQITNYRTQRSTYDELLSGSIANAIPDVTIRSKLANFYVALEGSEIAQQRRTPFRDNLRGHMPHAIQTKVREDCGDRYSVQSDFTVRLTLPERCDLGLDPLVISEAVSALSSYTELEKDLTRHLADIEAKLVSLEAGLSPTRELAEQLQEIGQ